MTSLRLKPLILLFAAFVLAQAQCLSACTIVSCHGHAAPESCHQTAPEKRSSNACAHDSFATPAKAAAELAQPAFLIAAPMDELPLALHREPSSAASILRAPPGLPAFSPLVLRI